MYPRGPNYWMVKSPKYAHLTKQQRSYQLHKNIGLCSQCNKNECEPGHTKCPLCLKEHREYMQKLRKSRIANGLCTKCGYAVEGPETVHGKGQCPQKRRRMPDEAYNHATASA